jgi:cbb3-type cytochrome oxidase maturation protein
MYKSILILLVLSFFLGLAAWFVFIWAVKKGEFDDIERPKYRMLDDEDASPGNNEKEDAHDTRQ